MQQCLALRVFEIEGDAAFVEVEGLKIGAVVRRQNFLARLARGIAARAAVFQLDDFGAEVGKARYGEPVGAVTCRVTEDGARDLEEASLRKGAIAGEDGREVLAVDELGGDERRARSPVTAPKRRRAISAPRTWSFCAMKWASKPASTSMP